MVSKISSDPELYLEYLARNQNETSNQGSYENLLRAWEKIVLDSLKN